MEYELLKEMYKLLRSYNPDQAMGPGMKARFISLRDEIEAAQLSESSEALDDIRRLSGLKNNPTDY